MCGIAGLIQKTPNAEVRQAFITAAHQALYRRGPDAQTSQTFGDHVALVHTRLAIIDIAGGNQPIEDDNGAIVFNGEIYNFAELRHTGDTFKTNSDTEVLLKGFGREGRDFLPKADGMFTFAYYDFAAKRLTLARDRFGIKQLYYYQDEEVFAFASTLAPLMLFSKKQISTQALQEYYLFRASRAPRTLFDDVHELEAGHALALDISTFAAVASAPWVAPFSAPRTITREEDAIAALDDAMQLAIKRHLVSDTPVASFLSGGVDSSLITGMAATLNPELSAFTLGFSDAKFDESRHAAAVCQKHQLRHHVHYTSADAFLEIFHRWPAIQDDAVADPSAVMLYKIAQFAREAGYKVLLSGEGADELFAGYNQHFRFALTTKIAPYGKFLGAAPWLLEKINPAKTRRIQYARQMTHSPYFNGTGMIFEPYLAARIFSTPVQSQPTAATFSDALLHDQSHRLQNDLLTRTDRATMAASIEARVPFLCAGVQHVANSISTDLLLQGKVQKALLKKYAEKYVPKECLYRPKVGFDLPLAGWMRGAMKPLVEETLATTWQKDYFTKNVLENTIDDHFQQKNNNADKIYAFILLEKNIQYLRGLPSISEVLKTGVFTTL